MKGNKSGKSSSEASGIDRRKILSQTAAASLGLFGIGGAAGRESEQTGNHTIRQSSNNFEDVSRGTFVNTPAVRGTLAILDLIPGNLDFKSATTAVVDPDQSGLNYSRAELKRIPADIGVLQATVADGEVVSVGFKFDDSVQLQERVADHWDSFEPRGWRDGYVAANGEELTFIRQASEDERRQVTEQTGTDLDGAIAIKRFGIESRGRGKGQVTLRSVDRGVVYHAMEGSTRYVVIPETGIVERVETSDGGFSALGNPCSGYDSADCLNHLRDTLLCLPDTIAACSYAIGTPWGATACLTVIVLHCGTSAVINALTGDCEEWVVCKINNAL